MQTEPNLPTGELLRRAMRHWVTGVSIVTSRTGDQAPRIETHGMTVNSFVSISLDPPLVTVTMNSDTRTCYLVQSSGVFAVTVLSQPQMALAEQFAGRGDPMVDRMLGVETFPMITGAPLLKGGLAFVDCRVVHQYPMLHSILFIGEVLAADSVALLPETDDPGPLIYFNRKFTQLV